MSEYLRFFREHPRLLGYGLTLTFLSSLGFSIGEAVLLLMGSFLAMSTAGSPILVGVVMDAGVGLNGLLWGPFSRWQPVPCWR